MNIFFLPYTNTFFSTYEITFVTYEVNNFNFEINFVLRGKNVHTTIIFTSEIKFFTIENDLEIFK